MNGSAHIVAGVALVAAADRVVPLAPDRPGGWIAVLVLAALGALLPDVDSDEATIRQWTGTARSDGCLGRLVSLLMGGLGGHRALTHTLAALALATVLALGVAPASFDGLAVAFALGYLSHLLADGITKHGVPLLWPLVRRRVHLLPRGLRITTGGILEYLLMVAFGVVIYQAAPWA